MSVFVPYTKHFFTMFKAAITEVELDDQGKHRHNLAELNKVQKQPQRYSEKKMFL